jgi:glutamine---fructose-6-phosphate transaminase (isomerizing)
MCGIVGILGQRPAAPDLVDALARLEYRGYDSAGIAVLEGGGFKRVRAAGKLSELRRELEGHQLAGTSGIGHTRWATHGAPTEVNAHPHIAGRVAMVHNGIIENFRELKEELAGKGVTFESQTDTEVVAHLIDRALQAGRTPREAMAETLDRLRGAFAFAILFEGEDDLMIGARRGSPLAVGHGEGQMYLGSDAIGLAPFTNRVTYLEDGDWVVLTRRGAEIHDSKHRPVERAITYSQGSNLLADKGGHRHFMAKEIAEQPEVVGHTLAEYLDFGEGRVRLPEGLDFAPLQRLTITACGTAFFAGLVARYWFEKLARLPVEADIASEFRYREAPLPDRGWPSSFRSRARPPTRSPRCAIARSRANRRPASSTWRSRRSRAIATSPFGPSPVPRSASPRPRRSPASSPCWQAWRSRRGAPAAPCRATMKSGWSTRWPRCRGTCRAFSPAKRRSPRSPGASPIPATCSTWGAASTIRWRSKARSS